MNSDPIDASMHVPLSRCEIGSNAKALVRGAINSGWLGYGPLCRELEGRFAAHGGWAVALQSCTAAMWTTAMILRQTTAPEVIMPAITYAACSAAFRAAGWNVRFADVDKRTGLIDLTAAAALVGSQTKALLIVDLYGQRAPAVEARALCDAAGMALVHDKAHRLDLWDNTCPVADFACYSFGPVKEAPSPEGGLLWSKSMGLEDDARAVSLVGLGSDTWSRSRAGSEHLKVPVRLPAGLKMRQNDVAAAFVLGALDDVPTDRLFRRRLYERLAHAAPPSIYLPPRESGDSLLMCYARVLSGSQDAFRRHMATQGISTSDHYPSLARCVGSKDECPTASVFAKEVVTLPMFATLKENEVAQLESALKEYAYFDPALQ